MTIKAAREPGWYWVRSLGDRVAVAEWCDGRWLMFGDPEDWLDSDFAEIDERRITRAAPQPESLTITEAQRREIAEAWEHLDRLIDGYASAKAALHAALMLPGIVPILGGRDD